MTPCVPGTLPKREISSDGVECTTSCEAQSPHHFTRSIKIQIADEMVWSALHANVIAREARYQLRLARLTGILSKRHDDCKFVHMLGDVFLCPPLLGGGCPAVVHFVQNFGV